MPAPNAEQVERAREINIGVCACRAEDGVLAGGTGECAVHPEIAQLLADEAERVTTREREWAASLVEHGTCAKQPCGHSLCPGLQSLARILRAGDAG